SARNSPFAHIGSIGHQQQLCFFGHLQSTEEASLHNLRLTSVQLRQRVECLVEIQQFARGIHLPVQTFVERNERCISTASLLRLPLSGGLHENLAHGARSDTPEVKL